MAQPKRLVLLTYLALAVARGSVRRDTLVAIFWPELDAEHARGALSRALRFLRRELGDDIFSSRGGEEIELEAHRVWCDVTAFEGACRKGDDAPAVELYRGDLLEGLHVGDAVDLEQWLDGERDRLARLYADALTGCADAFVRQGDAPGAIACLRRLVEREPYNATVAVKYMQALVSAGDRPAPSRTRAPTLSGSQRIWRRCPIPWWASSRSDCDKRQSHVARRRPTQSPPRRVVTHTPTRRSAASSVGLRPSRPRHRLRAGAGGFAPSHSWPLSRLPRWRC